MQADGETHDKDTNERTVNLLREMGKLIMATEEAIVIEDRRKVVLQGRTLAQEAIQLRDDIVFLVQQTSVIEYPSINFPLKERLLKELESEVED